MFVCMTLSRAIFKLTLCIQQRACRYIHMQHMDAYSLKHISPQIHIQIYLQIPNFIHTHNWRLLHNLLQSTSSELYAEREPWQAPDTVGYAPVCNHVHFLLSGSCVQTSVYISTHAHSNTNISMHMQSLVCTCTYTYMICLCGFPSACSMLSAAIRAFVSRRRSPDDLSGQPLIHISYTVIYLHAHTKTHTYIQIWFIHTCASHLSRKLAIKEWMSDIVRSVLVHRL